MIEGEPPVIKKIKRYHYKVNDKVVNIKSRLYGKNLTAYEFKFLKEFIRNGDED
jgi:hypothetical protein